MKGVKLAQWLVSLCNGVELAELMQRLSSSCGAVELMVGYVAQWLSTSCEGAGLVQ